MNRVVRKVKMNACRNATKISSRLIAMLPGTTGMATRSELPMLFSAADKMKLSSTASSTWPATMLAQRRTISAKMRATRPITSIGTSSHASHQGPGLKWAKKSLPPNQTPLTPTIPRVIRAIVPVIQGFAVADPPIGTWNIIFVIPLIGSMPSRFTVNMKKKTVQTNLMKRSVYSPSAGRATSLRRYSQIASKALPAPVGTSASTSPVPLRRPTETGTNRISSSAASIIITMWLSSRVILSPWVSHPRWAGCCLITCGTMCSSGFSASIARTILPSPIPSNTTDRVPDVERELRRVPQRDPDDQGARRQDSGERHRNTQDDQHREADRRREQPLDRRGGGPRPPGQQGGQRAHRRGDHSDHEPRDHRRQRAVTAHPPRRRVSQEGGGDTDRDRPHEEPQVLRGRRPGGAHRAPSPFFFLLSFAGPRVASSVWRIRLYMPPTRPRMAPTSTPQGADLK